MPGGRIVEDTDLVERLRTGDERALCEVVRRHRDDVVAAAAGFVSDHMDVDEVVADTFILLWDKRRRLEIAGSSLARWLVVSARYLALNRARLRPQPSVTFTGCEVAREPTPEDVVIARETVAFLWGVVARLRPDDGCVLKLCLIEDLSYKEAAARLDITVPALRNRLSRARRAVRVEVAHHLSSGACSEIVG